MATRITRRAGQTGQIDFQGRSHGAADCGTYRLVSKRPGTKTWNVEWIAPCDLDSDRHFSESSLRFVDRASYDRHF